jgi:hypothetical protein
MRAPPIIIKGHSMSLNWPSYFAKADQIERLARARGVDRASARALGERLAACPLSRGELRAMQEAKIAGQPILRTLVPFNLKDRLRELQDRLLNEARAARLSDPQYLRERLNELQRRKVEQSLGLPVYRTKR